MIAEVGSTSGGRRVWAGITAHGRPRWKWFGLRSNYAYPAGSRPVRSGTIMRMRLLAACIRPFCKIAHVGQFRPVHAASANSAMPDATPIISRIAHVNRGAATSAPVARCNWMRRFCRVTITGLHMWRIRRSPHPPVARCNACCSYPTYRIAHVGRIKAFCASGTSVAAEDATRYVIRPARTCTWPRADKGVYAASRQ